MSENFVTKLPVEISIKLKDLENENKELKNKLNHANFIFNLLKKFDFRKALIESRVYNGEIDNKHSEYGQRS
jgi:hypothetical protein